MVGRNTGPSDKGPQRDYLLLRQPEQSYLRQLKVGGQLLSWPADQPRHATGASTCPVETSSPP